MRYEKPEVIKGEALAEVTGQQILTLNQPVP